MRAFVVVPLTLLMATVTIAGCGSQSTVSSRPAAGSSTSSPSTSAQVSGVESATKQVCVQALPGQTLLGWANATVGQLRAYRYGPPNARPPLESAFAGVPATQTAAWCLVRISPTSNSLWGVAPGQQPRRALTGTGPGEGRYVGQMNGPPQPP